MVRRLNFTVLRRIFKAASERGGLDSTLEPHPSRHTFGTLTML
jgi:site-specific recombinase XerD